MRHFSVIIVFLIILGMANVALAEMYSWKDANGVRHYSNYPPPTGVTAASEQKEMVSTPAPVTKQPAAGTRPEQKFDADSRETRVIVLGNAVIVPVTFGYQGRQIEAKLLLDTGAAHTVYFETATSHKNIVEFKPIKGRVAGGGAITGQGIEVEYLRVGPKTQPDVKVFILKESGSTSGADGLLGMNFLKHHKHYVDLERKVIVWINK